MGNDQKAVDSALDTEDHSFASKMHFSTVSWAVNSLFSNKSLFLDFHKFHRTQGHKGADIPDGGRGVKLAPALMRSTIDVVDVGGLSRSGRRLQTSSA